MGEWSTTCLGTGRGNRIQLSHEIRFPHSLGLLYAAFTYYTGFRINSGEYKLMGLAPYGRPVYKDLILSRLVDLKPDGSYRMDMSYFNYCQGLTMTSAKFERLFGGPPRRPESEITQRHADLAASIQAVTDEVMLRTARHVYRQTGLKNLVMAGGVALNCVGNGRIVREGPFQKVWIQPASGDAGGALGAALFIWHQLLEKPRTPGPGDRQQGSLLGPAFSDEQIRQTLGSHAAVFDTARDDEALLETTAALLAAEKVVGWFQGRMEFGPRALGARSILGDARSPAMQSRMNLKVKFRESFRPFAPIVLAQYAEQYFQMRGADSPYMLLVAPVRDEIRTAPLPGDDRLFGLERLHRCRSTIPAVTHVDYSARVQTVDAQRNPLLCRLLTRFHQKTGCPVLINTSFNVRGEPIVCTPDDAYRCFTATDMDVLVLGRHVLYNERQTRAAETGRGPGHRARHLAQFPLD